MYGLFTKTSKSYREAVTKLHPRLIDPAHYSLYRNLTRGLRDPDRSPVLSHAYLAAISKANPAHFRSKSFLNSFKDVLPEFTFTSYSYPEGLAREVENTGLHQEDLDLLELHYGNPRNLVPEANLSVDSHRLSEVLEREYSYSTAVSTLSIATNTAAVSRLIIDYHNQIAPSIFRRLIKPNLADGMNWINANLTPSATFKIDGTLAKGPYEIAHDLLDAAGLTPKPIYRAVPNVKGAKAARVFEVHPGLTRAPKALRHILLRGELVEGLDLVNSQASIIASRWDIPELRRVIADGSLWQHLLPHFDATVSKAEVKTLFYALVFGSGIDNLKLQADEKTVDTFLDIPVVDAIFRARQKRFNDITDGKSQRQYVLDPLTAQPYYRRPTSEAALEVQAIEADIISTVYEAANDNDYRILLYVYDGLILKFRRANRVEALKVKISNSITKRAKRKWGVDMHVDWETIA